MIINRRAREKRILRQYEVEILRKQEEWAISHPNEPPPITLPLPQFREDGWDVSYLTLKKKYENN